MKTIMNMMNDKQTGEHGNYVVIVEVRWPHQLNLYIDYSKNRVVQKCTQVLRVTVARMILQNDSPCIHGIVAILWAQVASALIRHGAARS